MPPCSQTRIAHRTHIPARHSNGDGGWPARCCMSAALACQNARASHRSAELWNHSVAAPAFPLACAEGSMAVRTPLGHMTSPTSSSSCRRHCASAMQDSDEFCWICLDDLSKGQLINPCRCPRKVHPTCLARWQLQQAGRAEETQCRCAVTAHHVGRTAHGIRECIRPAAAAATPATVQHLRPAVRMHA